ncbi:MAG: 4-hydroxythreonine-4-phosphate dehydrogenase, partial [Pantoea sp. Brub]|nr:4-hydroxythreonine-4-phosphate dehydrogenase [Pantoea sp. Brub]
MTIKIVNNTFRIVITPGEPAGIGPDILIQIAQKTWPVELVVCASPDLLYQRANQLNLPLNLFNYRSDINAKPQQAGTLTILPIELNKSVIPGNL